MEPTFEETEFIPRLGEIPRGAFEHATTLFWGGIFLVVLWAVLTLRKGGA
jgi:hypothetical protein